MICCVKILCYLEQYWPNRYSLIIFCCFFSLEFLLEVTCNKVVGEGDGTFIGPPDENATYSLNKCCLSVRNTKVYHLLKDLKILYDIAKVNTCILFVSLQRYSHTTLYEFILSQCMNFNHQFLVVIYLYIGFPSCIIVCKV